MVWRVKETFRRPLTCISSVQNKTNRKLCSGEFVASVGHVSVLVCYITVDKSCHFLICATAGVPALFVSTWAVVRATLADVR